jgi:integrase
MASAWLYQRPEDVRDHREEAAAWHVGWYEPNGRRRGKAVGPGEHGKRLAEKVRRKIEAELMTGTYQMQAHKLWDDFHEEYAERIVPRLAPRSQREVLTALAHFKRIVKPHRVFAIDTAMVDRFIAARRLEPGKKKGSIISPATVNKDLRHIKAALRKAQRWGYLKEVLEFTWDRVIKALPTYITAEHFAAVYKACDAARMPEGLPYPPADWWRALLVTGHMTGWRIGDMLGFRRDDLDLAAGTAVTRGKDNKGKRDELVPLHPVVVQHLARIPGFTPKVFPWNHNERTLYTIFAEIQEEAGIHLPCSEEHVHTRFCHVYGFHDLRRAFATMNADKLTADTLQALMRHQSYQTTQVYINLARQMEGVVAKLHVPEILRADNA